MIKVFSSPSAQAPTIFADLRTNVHDFGNPHGFVLHPNFPSVPYVIRAPRVRCADRRDGAPLGRAELLVRPLPRRVGCWLPRQRPVIALPSQWQRCHRCRGGTRCRLVSAVPHANGWWACVRTGRGALCQRRRRSQRCTGRSRSVWQPWKRPARRRWRGAKSGRPDPQRCDDPGRHCDSCRSGYWEAAPKNDQDGSRHAYDGR